MVAPCDVGEPLCLYVRVSAKGMTSGGKAFRWDIARSSTVLPNAGPLHPLQDPLHRLLLMPGHGSTRLLSQQSPPHLSITPRDPNHSSPDEKQNEGPISTRKRLREEDEEEGVDGKCVSKVARCSKSISEARVDTHAKEADDGMEWMRDRALRQKKENLQRRLMLFLRLVRDRPRFHSLVKRLNAKVI